LKILYCYATDYAGQEMGMSASVGYRCRIPAIGLKRAGHDASLMSLDAFVTQTSEVQEKCGEADLIVVQRSIWRDDVWETVQKWQARGVPMVLEFDDAPQYTPMSVGGAAILWKQYHVIEGNRIIAVPRRDVKKHRGAGIEVLPPAIKAFRERLPEMDAVTVPSEGLVEDWKRKAKRIYLLKNYYDPGNLNWRKKKGNLGGFIVGWMGSYSHFPSWEKSGLIPELQDVVRRHPQVKVMVFGDRRIAQKLGLPADKMLHHKWQPFEEYPNVLRYFDAGVAPLAGQYAKRKSDQKVAIDYPLMRIPWVASRFGPYRHSDGVGGFLVSESRQWGQRLRQLIEDDGLCQAKGEEGCQVAQARSVEVGIENYLAAYREIMEGGRV